ncbi:hypothetical protein CBS101457_002148 [Exobasidium rhododendri]|nr:hypothetical protein CBS101457_002148 [Exobasidium rhododendri]
MSFPKELLLDIVSDVNEYKSFLPYCVESKVEESSRKEADDGEREEFLADLAIGFGQFQESYTSKVTISKGKSVQATAIPTPLFKRLETIWTFSPRSNDVTDVDFKIFYSFANPFYAAFAKSAIEKMTSKMIDAFKARATQEEERRKHV